MKRVVVHNGAELFGARLDLLNAWAARGAHIEVSIAWDPARAHAFTWTEASMQALETRGVGDVDVQLHDLVGEGPLAELRRCQFSPEATPGEACLVVGQATSLEEEARHVAREVLEVLGRGVPLHDVVVVTPDLDYLGEAIARELKRANVPSYMARGRRLGRTAPGRALAQMLELAARGYARESLIDLWRAWDVAVTTPQGVWSAATVARLLRMAGVRSMKVGGYRRPLEALGRRRDARRPEDNMLGCATAVADAIERLIDDLETIPHRGTAVEFAQGLRRVWMRWVGAAGKRAPWNVDDPDGAAPGTRDVLRAHTARQDAWSAVDGLLADLVFAARAVGAPKARWTREAYYEFTRAVCDGQSLTPHGTRSGRLLVTSPSAVVGARYHTVVMAGVSRGQWPRPSPRDPILGEEARRRINQQLIKEGGGPRLLQSGALAERPGLTQDARDTWLWLEMLYAARERAVITYTLDEASDHEGISPLVEEMVRASLREPEAWRPCLPEDLAGARAASATRRARWGRACAPDRLPQLSGWAIEEIQRHHTQTVHSPSRIDQLGMCPYRYFASSILRLTREDVPRLDADPREEGSMAHAALRAVYADIAQRGGLSAARKNEEGTRVRAKTVFESARDEILEEASVHPWLVEAELAAAWRAVEGQLELDLKDDEGFEPVLFEYAFGMGETTEGPPPLHLSHPKGTSEIRIRGSIDRVDRAPGMLRVLDYKRTIKQRDSGCHFQLPLYLAAALRDVEEDVETIQAGWSDLRRVKRTLAADIARAPEAFLDELGAGVWSRLDAVLAGDVAPHPQPADWCKACDYRPLCRYAVEADPDAAAKGSGGEP